MIGDAQIDFIDFWKSTIVLIEVYTIGACVFQKIKF